MAQSKTRQNGFTLVELMIAVAMVGVLSSVAINGFEKMTMQAKRSEAKSQLGALFTAFQVYYSEYGAYYGDMRYIGFYPNGTLRYGIFSGGGVISQNPPGQTGPFLGSPGLCDNTGVICAQFNGVTVPAFTCPGVSKAPCHDQSPHVITKAPMASWTANSFRILAVGNPRGQAIFCGMGGCFGGAPDNDEITMDNTKRIVVYEQRL